MTGQYVRLEQALILGALLVACSSPTAFDGSDEIRVSVHDAPFWLLSGEAVNLPLDLAILNQSSRKIRYVGVCGVARLNGTTNGSFSISQLCALSSSFDIEIQPGDEVSVRLETRTPRDIWGASVAGEYTLTLGLFVEGLSGAQLVVSTPFRINGED